MTGCPPSTWRGLDPTLRRRKTTPIPDVRAGPPPDWCRPRTSPRDRHRAALPSVQTAYDAENQAGCHCLRPWTTSLYVVNGDDRQAIAYNLPILPDGSFGVVGVELLTSYLTEKLPTTTSCTHQFRLGITPGAIRAPPFSMPMTPSRSRPHFPFYEQRCLVGIVPPRPPPLPRQMQQLPFSTVLLTLIAGLRSAGCLQRNVKPWPSTRRKWASCLLTPLALTHHSHPAAPVFDRAAHPVHRRALPALWLVSERMSSPWPSSRRTSGHPQTGQCFAASTPPGGSRLLPAITATSFF